MELVIQSINGKDKYCRTVSNELNILVESLKNCHNNKSCQAHPIVVPSGLSAMTVALDGLIKRCKPVNIIYGDELYCDTHRLIRYLNKYDQCPVYAIDVRNTQQILELFEQLKDQNNILVLESCSNPSGHIFDWKIIPKLRKISKILHVIVDNTWLTHVMFNPFKHNADIIVLSLTKYYGGGKHIAGSVITKSAKLYRSLNNYVKVHGLHVSPLACRIISEKMETLEQRIIGASEITQKVVEYMTINKMKFDHPRSHSQELSNKYIKNSLYPPVISFYLPLELNEAIKLVESLKIEFKTSYGSENTRISNYLTKFTDNETKLRLSIGYNDTYERLEQDVLSVLSKYNSNPNIGDN